MSLVITVVELVGLLASMVFAAWFLTMVLRPARPKVPQVDWAHVAELETEVYGQVLSEQAKATLPPVGGDRRGSQVYDPVFGWVPVPVPVDQAPTEIAQPPYLAPPPGGFNTPPMTVHVSGPWRVGHRLDSWPKAHTLDEVRGDDPWNGIPTTRSE